MQNNKEIMRLCTDCEYSCGESTKCRLIWRRPDNGQNVQLGLPKARSYEWACGARAIEFKKRNAHVRVLGWKTNLSPAEHTYKIGETVSERCERTRMQDCGNCEDFACGDNQNQTAKTYVRLNTLRMVAGEKALREWFGNVPVVRWIVNHNHNTSPVGFSIVNDLVEYETPKEVADDFTKQMIKKRKLNECVKCKLNYWFVDPFPHPCPDCGAEQILQKAEKAISYIDLDSLTAEFSGDQVRTFFNRRFGVDRLDVDKHDYVTFFGDLAGDLTQYRVSVILADEFRAEARKAKNRKIIDEAVGKSVIPSLYDVKSKIVKIIKDCGVSTDGFEGHSGICQDQFYYANVLVDELKLKLKTLRDLYSGKT